MSFAAIHGALRRTGIEVSLSLPKSVPANEFGAKNPVVLLFGWYGAKQRALVKVAHVYNALGLKVVLGTAKTRQLFFGASIEPFVEDMLDATAEFCGSAEEKDAPFIVQSCSNGGVFVYEKLLEALDEKQRIRGRPIAAAVFDSCPADLQPKATRNALRLGMGGWQGEIAGQLYWNVVRPFVMSDDRREGFRQNMLKDPLTAPQLYLYSRADLVTDYRFVEEVIEEKRARGLRVTSKRWEDTEHVAHLKNHPQEYHKLVADFLRENKIFAPAEQEVTIDVQESEEPRSAAGRRS